MSGSELYCPHSGRSLVPLDVPHLSEECPDCGKMVYFVRPGPDGAGIQAKDGERLTIPAGFLKLSLDPSSGSKLTRAGIPFLVKHFFLGNHPSQPDDMPSAVKMLEEEADAILMGSEKLKGINFEDEKGQELLLDRLKKDQNSKEWHAMTMGALSKSLNDAIEKGEVLDAAWSGYMLGTVRGLTIVTEPQFEQTLWRGYLANQVVYEAAAASLHTPGEAEAIKKLEPLFRKLDEATLNAWVESKLPIGPRIGVNGLPEEILVSLAKWHLASAQREREQESRNTAERRAAWELRLKWLSFGLTLAGAIVGSLKYFGIF